MAPTPQQIGQAVATEIPNFFNDSVQQFVAGEGEYLASGEPSSVISKIGQEVGRAYCRAYGAAPGSVNGDRVSRVEKACRPYLDSIGAPQGPTIKVPFVGGQCSGVTYQVQYGATATASGCDGSNPNVRTRPFGNVSTPRVGPIGSIELIPANPTNCGFGNYDLRVRRPNGTLLFGSDNVFSPGVSGNARMTLDSFTPAVVRVDGLPDDCGSLPPVVTDPPSFPNPTPPPFRFNPDPDIDIEIDVDILPDAQITFNIGGGPITIDPFADGDGGGDGGGGGSGPPPGDVGEPGTPGDTGDGGDADGEAPPGEVLTGLKINFLTPPVGGNEYAPGIYRGVCYVYMGTADGVDHDPAGAMLRDGQFIFAEKDNLTNWFVSANPGYNLRVTPYYRPVEGEE